MMETGGQKVRNRHSTKYYWDKTEYLHEFSEVLHLHSQKTPTTGITIMTLFIMYLKKQTFSQIPNYKFCRMNDLELIIWLFKKSIDHTLYLVHLTNCLVLWGFCHQNLFNVIFSWNHNFHSILSDAESVNYITGSDFPILCNTAQIFINLKSNCENISV